LKILWKMVRNVGLINVVNDLRNARNSGQALQMPMNDGTGKFRSLNENENILILNALAAKMRRG